MPIPPLQPPYHPQGGLISNDDNVDNDDDDDDADNGDNDDNDELVGQERGELMQSRS